MSKFEEDAVNQIRTAINVIQVDEGKVGEAVANLHPTLQQGFMRMAIGFLTAVAGKEYVDARNEATRDLAKKLLGSLTSDDMFLPLI